MKSFMAIFRVTSPIDINVPFGSSNNGFFLYQWLASLNNKHNFYKKEISVYFLQLPNIFLQSESGLRMHLVSHFEMKSAIIMVLLALVAVTQAKKAGMNNNNNNN